jgi:hypothetical protein
VRVRVKTQTHSYLFALTAALLLIFAAAPVFCQTTFGSIVGTVTDVSNAIIPQVKVTLTNLDTSEQRSTVTAADGLYEFVSLLPGRYRLDAEKSNFKHTTRELVTVQVENRVKIDLTLEVGATTQSIEVTEETPLLQPETSSLGQVITEKEANTLPLNGRNAMNLVALVPSVVPQGSTQGTVTGQNQYAYGNYQIGGGMANQSSMFLDGQRLNIAYQNILALIPTQDSVGEFKVQTNNLPPEYGRFAGGVVNFSTKAGTNQLHGGALEFLRNKVFNSNQFFSNEQGLATPPFTQNQFGANLGGPVVIPHVYDGRNKTFFFFNWESFRLRQGQTYVTTVPTPAERAGDFSAAYLSAGVLDKIYDPQTSTPDPGNPGQYVRQQFPNNIIPQSRFPLASIQLMKLFPLPNTAGTPITNLNNWVGQGAIGGNNNQYVVRLDQNVSATQHIFGRYTYFHNFDLPTDPFGNGACFDRCSDAITDNSFVLHDVLTLSPTTILDISPSYLRFIYARTPILLPYNLAPLGWPASLSSEISAPVAPTPIVSGFDPAGFFGSSGLASIIRAYDDVDRIAGSLTKIVGHHTFSMGGEYARQTHNFLFNDLAAGSFSFDSGFTSSQWPTNPSGGSGWASFLLGDASSGSQDQSAATASEQIYYAFYFGDVWKATRRLTFNLGIRWEWDGPWTERFNRMAYFQPNATNPVLQQAGLSFNGALGVVDSPTRSSRYGVNPDYRQFAPRVGIAYQLFSKTVIRSGYGIFWIPNSLSFTDAPDENTVNAAHTTFAASIDGGVTPYNTLNNPFPNGVVQPPGHNINQAQELLLGQSINVSFPDSPYGYMQQWNFDIQQQIGKGLLVDVGYAGAKGTHLAMPSFLTPLDVLPDQYLALGNRLLQPVANPFLGTIQSGPLSAPTVPAGQLLLPYPQYTGIGSAQWNLGESDYQSLQIKVQERFSKAGTLIVAYTFAKLLSNTDSLQSWLESSSTAGIQDANNLRGEYSLTSFDVPQRLVVSYVLDLPVGRDRKYLSNASGVVNAFLGGWGLEGITTFQRGFPLPFTTALNLTNSFGNGSRPDVVSGCVKGISGSAEQRLGEWFNTACFTQPPAFTFGNESRTDPTLRGQGISNFDAALFKNFPFGPEGRYVVQFRSEFFNLFNKPQFGPPNTAFGTPQFGEVTNTINNPRLIQFALRFSF